MFGLALLPGARRFVVKRDGPRIAYGLDFRRPVPEVHGFNLVVVGHTVQLELLDGEGHSAIAAIMPKPLIEDCT